MRDVRARLGRRSEAGAAALEFALVSVPLMMLVLGIIGYAYMLSFRQAISQGAAEGARAAAVAPAGQSTDDTVASARAALNDALGTYGVTCSGTTLQRAGQTVGTCSTTLANCSNDPTKQCATVAVDYAYRDNPLLPSFPGMGIVLPGDLAYAAVAQVSS
jgi:Flp pilus assembly protein TadG